MTTDDRLLSGASSLHPNKSSGDIVERLRFDAVRCELQFSKGVAQNIIESAAEIERLRREVRDANRHWNERCVELSVNAHGWMKAHDQLLGFIQSRPELLKVMMTEKPEIKYPSPADVPELVQRALTAESAVAAAMERAAKIEADTREKCAMFIEQRPGSIPDRQEIASAIRAAGAEKTAESGNSPSTHNSASE